MEVKSATEEKSTFLGAGTCDSIEEIREEIEKYNALTTAEKWARLEEYFRISGTISLSETTHLQEETASHCTEEEFEEQSSPDEEERDPTLIRISGW